jgi:hypothetical protein
MDQSHPREDAPAKVPRLTKAEKDVKKSEGARSAIDATTRSFLRILMRSNDNLLHMIESEPIVDVTVVRAHRERLRAEYEKAISHVGP